MAPAQQAPNQPPDRVGNRRLTQQEKKTVTRLVQLRYTVDLRQLELALTSPDWAGENTERPHRKTLNSLSLT